MNNKFREIDRATLEKAARDLNSLVRTDAPITPVISREDIQTTATDKAIQEAEEAEKNVRHRLLIRSSI